MDLENPRPKDYKCIYKAKNNDHITTGFAYFLILITQIFSLVFIDVFLWIEISPCFLIIEIVLTFLMFYHLIICHLFDPGVLKKGNLEFSKEEIKKMEDEMFKTIRFYKERYCSTCKIMRPPKSSHCRECDHCVKNFDHHCVFVGNCVGARNRANFIWFLSFCSVQALFRIAISIFTVFYLFQEKEGLKDAYYDQIDIFIGCFVFLGMSICLFLIWNRNSGVSMGMSTIAMIFVIAGSAKALQALPDLKYYEYPVFGLINIYINIPFVFWLIPLSTINYCNALLNITTKEREALNEAYMFDPNALEVKKKMNIRQKIKNLIGILFSSRIKSEIM